MAWWIRRSARSRRRRKPRRHSCHTVVSLQHQVEKLRSISGTEYPACDTVSKPFPVRKPMKVKIRGNASKKSGDNRRATSLLSKYSCALGPVQPGKTAVIATARNPRHASDHAKSPPCPTSPGLGHLCSSRLTSHSATLSPMGCCASLLAL